MEVIYHTQNGLYPFHPHSGPETAYVEHLYVANTPSLYQKLREVSRIYKSIHCQHLVRLHKVLRDDQEIHFLYDYHNVSVEAYLANRSIGDVKRIEAEAGCALKCLQSAGLRADIRIDNLGVDLRGSLKLFVTPDSLEVASKEELQEFYATEKTRIRFELQQIWERTQVQNDEPEPKRDKNPGFIISGNELIFLRKQGSIKTVQGTNSNTSTSTPTLGNADTPDKQPSKSQMAKNIISEIEKQRQMTEKLKNRRKNAKEEQEAEVQSKGTEKYASPSSKDEETSTEPKFRLNKRNSIDDSEAFSRKQQHRNSTGATIFLPNTKNDSLRLVSSAADTSKNKEFQAHGGEERPTSSLRGQARVSYNSQGSPSAEELKEIASSHLQGEGTEEEPKFHITTEMVSKYRMKIVTCQEIEFEGKEGEDIQKLAQEKLLQYQNQHGYPQIMMEPADEEGPDGKPKSEECREQGQNEQILSKILKAKQKASSALKEYAKTKKK